MGLPDDVAQRCADRVDAGDILLAVKCDGQCQQLETALNRFGAFDVDTSSRYGAGYAGSGFGAGYGPEYGKETGSRSMPIREERLIPHQDERRAGEVEGTKSITEEERTMRVPLRREEVHVEQRQVQPRPAQGGPEEGTIRVPMTEEQVTISKEPVVTGEVDISKRPVSEEREVRGQVRKEVPHIEKKGDVTECPFVRRLPARPAQSRAGRALSSATGTELPRIKA